MQNDTPQQDTNADIPPTSRTVIQPLSDMSEFEAKPYAPDQSQTTEQPAVEQPTHQQQPEPIVTQPGHLSPEEAMKEYEENKKKLPQERVAKRVPILKLFIVLSFIVLALPFAYILMYSLWFAGTFAAAGYSINPLALFNTVYMLPAIILPLVLVGILVLLLRTRSVKVANIVFTVLIILFGLGLFVSLANAIYFTTRGFNMGSAFFSYIIGGFFLYFMLKVRKAIVAAK